jgi:protein MAK11
LISSSEDGQIFLWRVKDFRLIHILKTKNMGAVKTMAVHPSGKVLLAVYKKDYLVVWDLTKGKEKAKRKVRSDVKKIIWDRLGGGYLMVGDTSVAVVSLADESKVGISVLSLEDHSTRREDHQYCIHSKKYCRGNRQG